MTIPTVRIYGRPGCHLCEQAEDLLEDLMAECPMSLETIDITTDADIFTRYRYEIPVIVVEGGGTASGRITTEDLRRILRLGPPRPVIAPAVPEQTAQPRKLSPRERK